MAQGAARALKGCTSEEYGSLLDGGPLDRLRDRLAGMTEPEQEFEARELRRRIGALDRVVVELNRLERLKRLRVRILAPSLAPAGCETFLVCGGRVHPPGAGDPPSSPPAVPPTVEADHLDWLLVVDTFLRFPPPELTILPLAGRDYPQAA